MNKLNYLDKNGLKKVLGLIKNASHFVRNPAWSQAVAISADDLTAGYTAPSDGMIVGFVTATTASSITINVNGLPIDKAAYVSGTYVSWAGLSTPVCMNDVVTVSGSGTVNKSPDMTNLHFVPFEDSTIAEPEVVTPEYIRNQNILSDYESVTLASSAGAANTAQYDGFLSVVWPNPAGSGTVYVSQDGGSSWISDLFKSDKASSGGGYDTLTIPLRKGDKYYFAASTSISAIVAKARYYKLRDYRGR